MLIVTTRSECSGDLWSRRGLLRACGLSSLAWLSTERSGNSAARPETSPESPPGWGRAKSVILVYTSGGQSQLETWDPKPAAPLEIRGEFSAIPTSVPGTIVGEHLPRLAQLAHRFCIVRSVSHDDLDHGSASYLTLTGRFHPIRSSNPPARATDFPCFGAVLNRIQAPERFPYNAVHVNGPVLVPEEPAPGQDGGFLGREFEPLVVGDVSGVKVAVPCLDAVPGLPGFRLAAREDLRIALDAAVRDAGGAKALDSRQTTNSDLAYQQAFEMLATPRCRQAFDIAAEPVRVRNRYGRHRPGQACLMARRLVEAGVPLITVMWNHSIRGQDRAPEQTEQYGWDTHNDIFAALKGHLLPRFDESFSALLEDLDDRQLLNDTLVICLGEFGRAPLVAREPGFAGNSPGRKHWASVYSIVVAGAGVTPGAVLGASDKIAAQPVSQRVGPDDVAATIYWALGIDPSGHFHDAVDRPFPIATGQPITGLW
ncbi:MAG: DUF1501 domain-containing protein [Planctomycetaceae bacterium]|nr:MAG: DUF1501 domain-containing protein [Planctomycetaceae bacterium]